MKKRKITAGGLVPVGLELKYELVGLGGCLLLALLWSLQALSAIREKWAEAVQGYSHGREIVVTAFPEIIGPALYGFYVIAVGVLMLAAWHYAYHRRGARADYLMDRLPNRWEKHLRCLAVPIMGALAALLTAGLMWLLYRAYYVHWQKIACEAKAYWEGMR